MHPGRGISGKGYQLKGSGSVGYRLGDTLLISKRRDADWVSSSWYGKNGGYVQWAKKYNVKQFAESILFLQ